MMEYYVWHVLVIDNIIFENCTFELLKYFTNPDNILNKLMILHWATSIATLGHMWPMGPRLEIPEHEAAVGIQWRPFLLEDIVALILDSSTSWTQSGKHYRGYEWQKVHMVIADREAA